MDQDRNDDQVPPEVQPEARAAEARAPGPAVPLPRPLQEHLAQQLRAEYQLVADKPAFLGDPAIPVEFEHQLNKLDRREKAHERGIEAVKAALNLDDVDAKADPPTRR